MEIKLPAATAYTVTRRTAARLQKLSRFAESAEHIEIVPAQLRKPHTLRAWKNLTDDARLAHLSVRVREQITAEEIAKLKTAEAGAAERATAHERTHALVAPAPAPARHRFVIACVAGCGTFHPAASHKPVTVACGSRRESLSRKAADALSHAQTDEVIRALRREARLAERLGADFGRKQSKKAKARRRVICSNTRR